VEIPGKFILTFPTKDLSLVNDIVAVGELYENIMNWTIKFAGLETHYRAERIVFDIQISAGIHCRHLQKSANALFEKKLIMAFFIIMFSLSYTYFPPLPGIRLRLLR
jgi:hypothetical protein